MAFFRSYIAPFLIVLVFLIALVAVSARIVLPSDMMAPAPIEDMEGAVPMSSPAALSATTALPPQISELLHGQPSPV
ncbi:MAG: hypothetical protein HC886_01830 [Leptolyngbyaceae cyanobacterium SM1_1_3]|nr:hypothetical protein [Leptolyngbyaceae cyanobacterium SM1_1_3]NJN03126.1 hypothetical protein [Leptolyngbyaceae cyanobacterium RM1_1_2]NJO09156.1 hypothetical protein [Leptolyngbyaceae cyanobacterium SL_1_1]